MSKGPDLFVSIREHDLPPRWDGHPVTWGAWESTATTFVCPPQAPQHCEWCGSTEPSLSSLGNYPPSRESTTRQPHPGGSLYAFRCTDCARDRVLELSTGHWWDLDESDYTRFGSVPPNG